MSRDHHLERRAWADKVAEALTPDLLVPYVPPSRPLPLGRPSSLWIREGYTARDATSSQTSVASVGPVQSFAQMLADRLTAGRLHNLSDTPVPEITSTPSAGAVLMAVHRLERELDVASVLAAWRTALSHASLLVIGASIRACSRDGDDAGPPIRTDFLRQWTFVELQALLDHAGLIPAFGGIVPEYATALANEQSVGSSEQAIFVVLGVPTAPS